MDKNVQIELLPKFREVYHLFHLNGEFFSSVYTFNECLAWLRNGGRAIFMTRVFSAELSENVFNKEEQKNG